MKDLTTWLRAAAILQSRRPEVHFWLCGGCELDLQDSARAALSLMHQRGQVHFSDFRPDPWRVYPALDLFSLSSRTEACPMSLMEAMSCGVPCAATDVGDCARLLEGIGRVVPAHEPEALAAAWMALLDAPRTSEEIRRVAVERFDIQAAARSYQRVYEEVLGS
jgi:glycosyltransferase involved in cell wall biosynthesis